MQDLQLYKELNAHWKTTSKVILGEEIGELSDFEEWLSGKIPPVVSAKSANSGKDVSFVLPHKPEKANAISLDEIDFNKKFEALDINEIKDIDSILEAVQERIYYCGNMILGNSTYIEKSTDVIESHYCYDSAQVSYSKHISHCYNFEYSDSVFGSVNFGYCKYCVSVSAATYATRCFEVSNTVTCSDSLYSNGLFGCSNCIFSFNQRNANYRIGNLQLTPQKYADLKKKLVSEIAELLKKDKQLPDLFSFFSGRGVEPSSLDDVRKRYVPGKGELKDQRIIEKAFKETTGVVLGRQLTDIERYGPWLKENTRTTRSVKSALSGDTVIIPDHGHIFSYPANRIVSQEEAVLVGTSLHLEPEEVESLKLSNAGDFISKIGFFTYIENIGKCANNIKSEITIDSVNFLDSITIIQSRNGAFNHYVLQAEHIFGCNSVRKSSFLINCYLSASLSRCFEVDSSSECSDCYFCHNCENVRDSMFSFNLKSKRNSIGNEELPKEKYLSIKEKILEEISGRIEKDGKLNFGILNLGRTI